MLSRSTISLVFGRQDRTSRTNLHWLCAFRVRIRIGCGLRFRLEVESASTRIVSAIPTPSERVRINCMDARYGEIVWPRISDPKLEFPVPPSYIIIGVHMCGESRGKRERLRIHTANRACTHRRTPKCCVHMFTLHTCALTHIHTHRETHTHTPITATVSTC